MLTFVADFLTQMREPLDAGYRLIPLEGSGIRGDVLTTDALLGAAIRKTPSIEMARADFRQAVERATAPINPARPVPDDRRRVAYWAALASLRLYSLALTDAQPFGVGQDVYNTAETENPISDPPERV